jgi:hypothetical protein
MKCGVAVAVAGLGAVSAFQGTPLSNTVNQKPLKVLKNRPKQPELAPACLGFNPYLSVGGLRSEDTL